MAIFWPMNDNESWPTSSDGGPAERSITGETERATWGIISTHLMPDEGFAPPLWQSATQPLSHHAPWGKSNQISHAPSGQKESFFFL